MEAQGIGYWLTKRAFLSGDREALVDGPRRLTYRELNSRVNRLSRYFQSIGLKHGDRCAMLAYNCSEYVEVIFAAAKLGLILVPLNWRLSPAELAFNLADSKTDSLVFDPGFTEMLATLQGQGVIKRMLVLGHSAVAGAQAYEEMLAAQPGEEPLSDKPVGLDAPHIIMYTAGTTGRPKGAVLSQGASFWNAINLNQDICFTRDDRNLLALPLFHIGGIGLFTLPMLYAGGTVVIQRTFDPTETLKLLVKEKITLFFGVPAIFLFLIQHPGFTSLAFEKVRLVMSGGAPLPVSLVKQYHDEGIILQQGFGMSEAAPGICTLSKELSLKKAGSIGRAVFHIDVRVVDENMQDLPVDQVGELIIRGPNVMQGYWEKPEATAEAFMGGWFHTGDLARMDEEGDVYIVDRKKDMFISGGENVYPAEVENALYDHPDVSEAAVIGISDPKWGEVGKAFVVPKPGKGISEKELLHGLKDRLARFKVPKIIVMMDKLPRNAAGKVMKNILKGN